MEDDDLNPDAIYAALRFVRDFAESPQGKMQYAEFLDVNSKTRDDFEKEHRGAKFTPLPKLHFSDQELEAVFPGERVSVDCGIKAAQMVIFGPPALTAQLAENHDAIGVAVRRFLADKAN